MRTCEGNRGALSPSIKVKPPATHTLNGNLGSDVRVTLNETLPPDLHDELGMKVNEGTPFPFKQNHEALQPAYMIGAAIKKPTQEVNGYCRGIHLLFCFPTVSRGL